MKMKRQKESIKHFYVKIMKLIKYNELRELPVNVAINALNESNLTLFI